MNTGVLDPVSEIFSAGKSISAKYITHFEALFLRMMYIGVPSKRLGQEVHARCKIIQLIPTCRACMVACLTHDISAKIVKFTYREVHYVFVHKLLHC